MIAGRLELLLLLFIVVHAKEYLLIVGGPQTVHALQRLELLLLLFIVVHAKE